MFSPSLPLENGISIRECTTSGSNLEINYNYQDIDCVESDFDKTVDVQFFGKPVPSFEAIENSLVPVNGDRCVKKKIIEEGGGSKLNEGCTVFIAYEGYWENVTEPFSFTSIHKLVQVDLNDNGLPLGLQTAVKSMLVGEYSMYLLSYEVMYGIMGVPPRIKPKANCVYYIKLVKSILTPKNGEINFTQPNMFHRVNREVKKQYMSGIQLYYVSNYSAAVQLFRKSVAMLNKCRLANEKEEKLQENLLLKLYLNLAICYNHMKLPLKACVMCNEINYLKNIWNIPKALFQNAIALRLIGELREAKRKLTRALKLEPDNEKFLEEMELLNSLCDSYNYSKLFPNQGESDIVSEEFKKQLDELLRKFKEDDNIYKFSLPKGLNKKEIEYIKKLCKEKEVLCSENEMEIALDKKFQDHIDFY